MNSRRVLCLLILVGVFVAVSLEAERPAREEQPVREAIANWPAPAFWQPPAQTPASAWESLPGTEGILASASSPMPFVAVDPCRLVDTRGPNGTFGGPIIAAGTSRDFPLASNPACPGIPMTAAAYSLNFTTTQSAGGGALTVYPTGGAFPPVSTMNFEAGRSIANAAIVAAGTGGSITVFAGTNATHVIIDINGYYAGGVIGYNTFLGVGAGNFTMTGNFNTGIGVNALALNTTGNFNTASGVEALAFNTTGNVNTASGVNALYSNTEGFNNTASGVTALYSNTRGVSNTASGVTALRNNTEGSFNTASGQAALYNNIRGGLNTAIGYNALGNNTGGSQNIAVGFAAGGDLTTGSNNICIGNFGVSGESNTIRIGEGLVQIGTFIAGIFGRTSAGGTGVFVNSDGKLGTTTSSRRYKEQIVDMGEESDVLMKLRPVAFFYKPEYDGGRTRQYGLVAEEVAEVAPGLVVLDREGKPETVRYHLVNALLLNEVQKQRRSIEGQQAEIEGLKGRLAALEGALLGTHASGRQ